MTCALYFIIGPHRLRQCPEAPMISEASRGSRTTSSYERRQYGRVFCQKGREGASLSYFNEIVSGGMRSPGSMQLSLRGHSSALR